MTYDVEGPQAEKEQTKIQHVKVDLWMDVVSYTVRAAFDSFYMSIWIRHISMTLVPGNACCVRGLLYVAIWAVC